MILHYNTKNKWILNNKKKSYAFAVQFSRLEWKSYNKSTWFIDFVATRNIITFNELINCNMNSDCYDKTQQFRNGIGLCALCYAGIYIRIL